MTVAQLEKRVAALEAEVKELRSKLAAADPAPGSVLNLFGKYKDDPTFDEATRLGREWRERENRRSLKELDRQEQKLRKRSKKDGKPSKPRKASAGA